jgi:hypothetical protein
MATRESVIHSVQQQKSLKYESGDVAADVLNGIGAVAYLLESLSDGGNDPIDGTTAYGLSIVLRHYAACADRYLTAKAPKARC